MKFSTTLMALASTAFAQDLEKRGGHEEGGATTLTTYTTVTTCPVTSTYTKEGTTYCETLLTTSTIVVTECNGCGGGVTTVQGPDVTKTALETDYTTITSLCPVTETKVQGGSTIVVTYTTTEYIKKNGYTTIYETVKAPDVTQTAVETDYETITSLCPVTETKVEKGSTIVVTYTTTEYIKKNAYTTIYETQKLPDQTQVVHETDYQTVTSLCPVTEIKTVSGELKTITYTSTSIYVTQVKQVVEQTQYLPGHTETAVEVAHETITSLCPVTEVKTVSGQVVTKVFTTTSIIVQQIPTTIEAVETIVKTVEGQEVYTEYSKVYVTVGGGTVVQTVQAPPTKVVVPETSVVQQPPVTVTNEAPATTAPVEVPPNAAQGKQAPAIALIAGIVGLLAVF